MRAAKGHFRVTGDGKCDALTVVANDLLDDRRNGVLARLVDIVQANFGQREILQAHHQAFHNARRVGAAAAGNRQNEWGVNIFSSFQRNVSMASRIFLTCSP